MTAGTDGKPQAMKLIRDELGVETEIAFKICDAIKDGRIKEPKASSEVSLD